MKRRLNTLKGKKLVTGDPNLMTKDEICINATPNGVEVKEIGTDGKIKDLAGSSEGSSEDRKYYKIYEEFLNILINANVLDIPFGFIQHGLVTKSGYTVIGNPIILNTNGLFNSIEEISFIKNKVFIDGVIEEFNSFDNLIDGIIAQGVIPSDIKNYYKEISKEESLIYQLLGE